MRLRLLPLVVLTLALRTAASPAAQTPQAQDSRRAYASRAELEATLAEAEKVIASPGYSDRLRKAKSREAEAIRQRLRDGDFQVGDQIRVSVVGEQQFTDSFTVASGRIVTFPGMPPISLQGVLRHESEAFLTNELKKVLKDPEVTVTPMIRLSILGQVGRPGFYQFPADMVVTDVIMQVGGPAQGADPGESTVRRSGGEIVSKEEFALALEQGQTLDQLNLRAGDELVVDEVRRGGISFRTFTVVLGTAATTLFLISRIHRIF